MVIGPQIQRHVTRRRGRAGRSAGFTLLEMMLVFALIATLLGALVLNIESMMRQSELGSVEGAFWQAARAARTDALLKRRTETVRYDEKEAAFVVNFAGEVRRFKIDRKDWNPDTRLEVAFMKRLASSQFTLRQGQLVDLREIPSIQFFQDGTCMPFVLNLQVGDTNRRIEVDPWTGAELLPDEDDKR